MSKKLFIIALKICVSAGLIWYALSGVDLDQAWAELIQVRPAMVAVAAMQMLLQGIIGGLRWGAVLRAIDHPLPLRCLVRLYYVGVYFNQVLPGGTGGDGVRMYMTYKEGLELRGAINGVILERVAVVLALVLLVGATLPFFLLSYLDVRLQAYDAALQGQAESRPELFELFARKQIIAQQIGRDLEDEAQRLRSQIPAYY